MYSLPSTNGWHLKILSIVLKSDRDILLLHPTGEKIVHSIEDTGEFASYEVP
jgi:hypothetical protein